MRAKQRSIQRALQNGDVVSGLHQATYHNFFLPQGSFYSRDPLSLKFPGWNPLMYGNMQVHEKVDRLLNLNRIKIKIDLRSSGSGDNVRLKDLVISDPAVPKSMKPTHPKTPESMKSRSGIESESTAKWPRRLEPKRHYRQRLRLKRRTSILQTRTAIEAEYRNTILLNDLNFGFQPTCLHWQTEENSGAGNVGGG